MVARRPLRRVVLLVAAAVLSVGCKANAHVGIAVEPDGSGTVTVAATFDAEAVEQLGDLASSLQLDDLRAAGWKVIGPKAASRGSVVTLTKAFARPADLTPIMAEVGGSSGLFGEWQLSSSDSFTVAEYELTGSVKLTGSLDQFSDARVAAALDGFAVGRSPDELAAALEDHPDALTLQVSAQLPGDLDTVDGLTAKDPDSTSAGASYVLANGKAVDVPIRVTASSSDRSPVLWILVGAGLVVAAALLMVARSAAKRRRRPRRMPTPSPT